MSFSSDVKKELSNVKPEKSCCALSELCGLYASMASLNLLGRGQVNVQFSSESLAVCRRAYTLLSQALHITAQIHYVSSARFGGKRKCVLTLGPIQSPMLLCALGMMEKNGEGSFSLKSTAPRLPLTRGCCMRAFLRGMLLGGGTMTNPEQSYHLEIAFRDEETRVMLAKCMQRLELPIRISARRDHDYLYLKQSDQIVTLLTALGAHASVMRIEDLRVRRQVLGTVNRALNCDSANLQKQMNASSQQLEAIRQLIREDRLTTLPPSLQKIALARLNAPDATLEQLGQSLDPPLGKSGVNHRMRRLMSYFDDTHLSGGISDLRNHNIIGRERAALIASTASRFQSTLTLERDGIVLNLKSMIGLLSQTIPKDGLIWVVADGVDEQAATDAVMSVLTKQL